MQHASTPLRAVVFGASGFAGLELTRLLAQHPGVEVVALTSDRWVGQSVASRTGVLAGLNYVTPEDGVAAAKGCQVALLATPNETSLELAPRLLALGLTVVDLSGAFRLKDAALYPRFYGFTHTHPELLAQAVYAMPELSRDGIRGATLIANPGCYPTAATLALAPLVARGLVSRGTVVVNAASGVSGAGRKATEEYSFMEISQDFRTYKALRHQHSPEIVQASGISTDALVFTPHLLPLTRGILSTMVATLAPGADAAAVRSAYADAYGKEPLVTLLDSADAVRLSAVTHTPRTLIGASVDAKHLVVVSAIDNLLKGAASQAVQNLNLAFGLPELSGLGVASSGAPSAGVHAP